MARVDKTNSAIGVVRATLSADVSDTLIDTVVGVGLNASGQIVVGGAGQTGFIGVILPTKWLSKAGQQADIFKLGDIVEVAGLTAGRPYFLTAAGALSTVATGNTYVGYTVEADRLVLQIGADANTGASFAKVTSQTAPAAAAVPFANLTDAANSFNALRTALINSGVLTA